MLQCYILNAMDVLYIYLHLHAKCKYAIDTVLFYVMAFKWNIM